MEAVQWFMMGISNGLAALPPLDEVIAYQWMAKKAGMAGDARLLTALGALASAGLGFAPNTRYDAIA